MDGQAFPPFHRAEINFHEAVKLHTIRITFIKCFWNVLYTMLQHKRNHFQTTMIQGAH